MISIIGYYGEIIEVEVGTLVLEVGIGIGKDMLGKSPGNPGGSGPPIKEGGIPPKWGRGNIGEVAKCIRSNSENCNLFDFALRFWNHIFICVSVIFKDAENSARSEMDKYCFVRNFFSKADNCCVVKGVRGFRFGLCLRKVPIFIGPIGGLNVISGAKKKRNIIFVGKIFAYMNLFVNLNRIRSHSTTTRTKTDIFPPLPPNPL